MHQECHTSLPHHCCRPRQRRHDDVSAINKHLEEIPPNAPAMAVDMVDQNQVQRRKPPAHHHTNTSFSSSSKDSTTSSFPTHVTALSAAAAHTELRRRRNEDDDKNRNRLRHRYRSSSSFSSTFLQTTTILLMAFLYIFCMLPFSYSSTEFTISTTTTSVTTTTMPSLLSNTTTTALALAATATVFIDDTKNEIISTTTTASPITQESAPARAEEVAPEHDKVHLNVNVFDRVLKLRLRKVAHPQEHPAFKVMLGDVVNGRPVLSEANNQATKKNLTHALYQDPDSMAAVRLSYVPQINAYNMEGVIGNDLVIHPYDPARHDRLLLQQGGDPKQKAHRVILMPVNTIATAPPSDSSNNGSNISLTDDEAYIEPPSNVSISVDGSTTTRKPFWLKPPPAPSSSPSVAARGPLKMHVQHAPLVAGNKSVENLSNKIIYHVITYQQHHQPHIQESVSSTVRGFARPTADDFAMISDFNSYGNTTTSMAQSTAVKNDNITLARAKRSTSSGGGGAFPSIVWPEILLIVDYETFRMHEGDEERITNYFTTFWNAVDLRYRALPHPDIRLHLTGLIISRDPQFLPFIEDNKMPPPEDDAFDSKQALSDMGKHLFYYQSELPDFDMAMLITKLDMCRRKGKHGKCHRGTAGFAYVGGACHIDEKRKKFNKVGIVEDSGGFSGIIVSAHEVGHLLGAVHDGSAAPSYLGGPGATACLWEDGFIMSDLRHDERGFQWSTCTKEQFVHFLGRPQAQCLFNIPRTGVKFSEKLPGKTISLDWQCRLDRGSTACFKDTRVCTQLYCHDKATGYCIAFRPAAEGSACGQGVHCIDGQCVSEQEYVRSRSSRKHLSSSGSDRAQHLALMESSSLSDAPPIPPPEARMPPPLIPSRAMRSAHHRSPMLREMRSNGGGGGGGGLCRDVRGVRISGLPCGEFMQRTSNAFCEHYDVLRYCCSTRRAMCYVGEGGGDRRSAGFETLQQRYLHQQQMLMSADPQQQQQNAADEILSAFGGSDHMPVAQMPASNGGEGSMPSSSGGYGPGSSAGAGAGFANEIF